MGKNLLIIDNSKDIKYKCGYSIKTNNFYRVTLKNRLEAAWLVFSGKAYAHTWYNTKELNSKIAPYHEDKMKMVDCINGECECFDDSCELNCSASTAVFNMCGIYKPEGKIK
jgi:hypothetical protein